MIKQEFRRITTIDLEQTFLKKLDFYTPKLLEIMSRKGGVSGIRIRSVLNSIREDNIERKRDAIIPALMEYLGEPTEELIKKYQNIPISSDEEAESFIMKICTFEQTPSGASRSSIVIEGVEFSHTLQDWTESDSRTFETTHYTTETTHYTTETTHYTTETTHYTTETTHYTTETTHYTTETTHYTTETAHYTTETTHYTTETTHYTTETTHYTTETTHYTTETTHYTTETTHYTTETTHYTTETTHYTTDHTLHD
ncbi:hypothetical protein WMY93_008724 [Mugilogobius chulae]|uniref:Uncharacterized protein n=1 Tax=Mugilogobius chulae TaxID=88201 RepID=A0AAW0PEU4_9GOBI